MKKRLLSLTLIAALCLSLFPVGTAPALAAAPKNQVIYVGGQNVTSGGYWTTDSEGNVTSAGATQSSDNYIHYDTETNTLTLHSATIKKSLQHSTDHPAASYILGSAIGVFNQDDDAELTIELEGDNTIEEVGKGIYVLAYSTGDASLTITGNGSLEASGSQTGIWVQSNSGNASLTIQGAVVEATGTSYGVNVQSCNSSTASLSVDGGSLTASGSPGILYDSSGSGTVPNTTALTISNSAIVDARGGGIGAGFLQDLKDVSPADNSVGIVFGHNRSDSKAGTVYGSVTLREDLTIGKDESLDIPSGASLTIDSGATLTVNGGKLTGNVPQSGVVYKVTEVTLDKTSLTLDVGKSATLTATITPSNATNQNVAWSSDNETVATVSNGLVTAIAPGTATITVTTADGNHAATCTVTVTEKPVYSITASPAALNFGSIYDDQAAPAAQTVTITNTGNRNVTVNLPTSTNYTITAGTDFTNGTATLDPDKTATFTVQPKAGLAAGSYEENLTISGTGGTSASVALRFSVRERPYIPPTPPSVSEETIDAILDAEPGETVSVALEDGDTTLDAEVFETLAGQDITLEIALEGGVTWTVNGQDIPADANLDDLDLGVEMNSDGIPVDVVNSITGERDTVQMTLAHDGDFGFTMTLTAPLGAENSGYWANLYHYKVNGGEADREDPLGDDEADEQLTFETAARIDDNGNAALPLSHASQYAIVIDDHSHATIDLPFSDVSAGDWFYDPVCYVYAGGLMTGVSDTAFAPEATTTRAMIVSMLARMENVTSAADAGFADVAADDWYATAVNWAASAGIVSGISDDTFAPNDPITREQLAAMLMKYAHQYKGLDVSARTDLSHYSDQPSTWAEDVVSWAVAEGLLNGVTDDQLQPQAATTRAQTAAVFQRFLTAESLENK